MSLALIKDILKNPKGKLICVDLDGTLCDGRFYREHPLPKEEAILKVQSLHERGAFILIYTARQEKWYGETKSWLIKYQVPFIGIAMRHKPNADVYIDDKAINIEDFMYI